MNRLSNHEYERALLGAVLLDNTKLLDFEAVRPDFFTAPVHRDAFVAIRDMIASGEPANIATVTHRLGSQHAGAIAALTDSAIGAVDYYAGQLRELWRKRYLRASAQEAAEMLERDDADQVTAFLEERLTASLDAKQSGYVRIGDDITAATDAIEQAINREGAISGISTGLRPLDRLIDGFHPEEYIVIGARPSVGKTAFALSMAWDLVRNDVPVGFFSLEMSRLQIQHRLIALEGRVEAQKLRSGRLLDGDVRAVVDAAEAIHNRRFFISDTPNAGIAEIVSEARRMKRREGIEALFVDYLGLIRSDSRDIPRWQQISEISRRLKQLARELSLPVVAMAQLTRDYDGKRPSLASLRDSGSIEEDSDVVMFLHPSGDLNATRRQTECLVAKARNALTGSIDLIFDRAIQRFYEEAK